MLFDDIRKEAKKVGLVEVDFGVDTLLARRGNERTGPYYFWDNSRKCFVDDVHEEEFDNERT
ncbi:MAG: hypothetical protein MN733_42245 [Nitrososphaera sp.]|nr:hypothetical protein [Nitrososphaera sp.]